MGRPTHDDPDLDKASPKPPAGGKRDAHRRQTPNNYAPQRPEKDDLRQIEKGDKKRREWTAEGEMVEATCPHCGCHMPYPIDDRRRLAMTCVRCGKPSPRASPTA